MAIHPAVIEADKLLRDCDERRGRGSGPGGQHRNKVETAVFLTHQSSGISAAASERRSQNANRKVALFRLRVNLALAVRVPIDRNGGPPEVFRLPVSAEHDDFPGVLAAALDATAGFGFDVKAAAGWLQCSPSQLLRLLRVEPRALEQVNHERAQRDLRPLR